MIRWALRSAQFIFPPKPPSGRLQANVVAMLSLSSIRQVRQIHAPMFRPSYPKCWAPKFHSFCFHATAPDARAVLMQWMCFIQVWLVQPRALAKWSAH